MNIMQICNQLEVGGTERVLEIITRFLNKDIFNVYVCGIQGGIREKMLREDGFDVYIVDANYENLVQLMKDKRIDIVHIHRSGENEPLPIKAAKKANVPAIIETNVFGKYDNSEAGKLIDFHLQISKTASLRYVQNAGTSINRFLNKCRVLYNPVNLEEFDKYRASEKQMWRFKSETGVDKNTPLICRVGRPDINKWDSFLVDMMAYLVRKVPDVRFLIVGGLPRLVRRKIEKLGLEENFIETGFASEDKLIVIYCSIDLLAHSSRIGESFGYTIAEAMAAGKPVVVNSTPWADNAQIELVDNGKTGFVMNTPKTYAGAVAWLIENKKEAKKMGLAGRKKVEREYDARKITKMLERLYIELLIEKGVSVGQDLINKYKEIQYFPTDSDILNYPKEYKKRLNNRYGESSSIEELRFKFKWLLMRVKNLLIKWLPLRVKNLLKRKLSNLRLHF